MSEPMDPTAITPADSPMTLGDIMASPEHLELMTPEVIVGQEAVDFDLSVLGRPMERVRLSQFAGSRPVALIFGSYT
jgi:hypothetical protein